MISEEERIRRVEGDAELREIDNARVMTLEREAVVIARLCKVNLADLDDEQCRKWLVEDGLHFDLWRLELDEREQIASRWRGDGRLLKEMDSYGLRKIFGEENADEVRISVRFTVQPRIQGWDAYAREGNRR